MWVVPRLINRPVDDQFHQRDFFGYRSQHKGGFTNGKLWWHYSLSTSIQTLTGK